MSRPKKNNLEYFTHDIFMRNDKKIRAVRSRFGNIGYAVYCMVLEIIAEEDMLQIKEPDEVEWEILSGDIDIDTKELRCMFDYFVRVDLIQYDSGFFRCRQLEKRGESVFIKRGRTLNHLRMVSAPETVVPAPETVVPTPETVVSAPTCSRKTTNKSKLNKIKEKNKPYYPLSEKLKAYIISVGTDMVFKKSHLDLWANEFRLMVEQDGRTVQDIMQLIEKVFQDGFWSRNIRSAFKLRKQWNDGKLDFTKIKKQEGDTERDKFAIRYNKKVELIKNTIAKSYLSESECFRIWNEDTGCSDNTRNIPDHRVNDFVRFIKEYYTSK